MRWLSSGRESEQTGQITTSFSGVSLPAVVGCSGCWCERGMGSERIE